VTEAKTAAELEVLVRAAAGRDDTRDIDVSIQSRLDETPNRDCVVKYTDPYHGWGPTPAFIRDLADLKRRFHLK
jgi:hypothetical protein